eukprot:148109_1
MTAECQFEIFETVEVEYETWWYLAMIIDSNDQSIKVSYLYDEDEEEWIDKTSNRIARLYTHTVYEGNLTEPRPGNTGKLIYYGGENPCIFMCKSACIDQYDITTHQWTEEYAKYPENFSFPFSEQICFDPLNEDLYIMGNICNMQYSVFHCFNLMYAKFNIKTQTWTIKQCIDTTDPKKCVDTIIERHYLFFINDCLCMFAPFWGKTIIEKENGFVFGNRIETFPLDSFLLKTDAEIYPAIQVLRDEYRKQFITLSGLNSPDTIYAGTTDCKIEMKKYLFDISECKAILGFEGNILFLFWNYSDEWCKILCVDMCYGYKFEVDKQLSFTMTKELQIVVNNDNYAYFMECDMRINCRIALYDLIPQGVHDLYFKLFSHPLVFGYIAEISKQFQVSVPYDVVDIILTFYPLFI